MDDFRQLVVNSWKQDGTLEHGLSKNETPKFEECHYELEFFQSC